MKIKITVDVIDAVGAREFSVDVVTSSEEFKRAPRAYIAKCAETLITDDSNEIFGAIKEAMEVDAVQEAANAAQTRLATIANERRHARAK